MEDKTKTAELIENMTMAQLQELFFNYCQRDRRLLARRKFNFVIDVKMVENKLMNASFEEIVLTNE